MTEHPGSMPAWNLVLRFVLELAALAGLAYAGARLADGPLAVVLAVAVAVAGAPAVAAVLGGLIAVHLAYSGRRLRWLVRQR